MATLLPPVVDERSPRTKHEQVRAWLVGELSAGRLKPGDSLDSEQRMAEKLALSRGTIRQALQALEQDGIISRVHGKGTYIHEQARNQLRQRQSILALLVNSEGGAFYPELLRGFETAAGRFHHQILVCNTDGDLDRQASAILQLIDQEVSGVAMVPANAPTTTPAFHIRQLRKHGIPVVFCHRPVEGVTAPVLLLPFHQVGRRAGQEFVRRGHRRVAFLGHCRQTHNEQYLAGLREALREGGGELVSEFFSEEQVPVGQSYMADEVFHCELDRLWTEDSPPTGIFTTWEPLSETVYLHLLHKGLRFPSDVSLIGFGGALREGAISRRLAAVTLDGSVTGTMAADLLDRMRRGELPLEHDVVHELPIDFHVGETLGSPRG